MDHVEAKTIIRRFGLVRTGSRKLIGFEPETRALHPDEMAADAKAIASAVLEAGYRSVECVLVQDSRGRISVWVRTSTFWTAKPRPLKTPNPKKR